MFAPVELSVISTAAVKGNRKLRRRSGGATTPAPSDSGVLFDAIFRACHECAQCRAPLRSGFLSCCVKKSDPHPAARQGAGSDLCLKGTSQVLLGEDNCHLRDTYFQMKNCGDGLTKSDKGGAAFLETCRGIRVVGSLRETVRWFVRPWAPRSGATGPSRLR